MYMKQRGYLLAAVGLIGLWLLTSLITRPAYATGGQVLIVAMQTGSATDASAEEVTLANVDGSAVDLSNWRLQYKSATGTSWATKATLQGSLDGGDTLLVATSVYQTDVPHQTMTSGLAQAGGHIQLIDNTNITQDLLGWGSAAGPEGVSATAPQGGQSLLRNTDSNGNYIDTNNNQADFSLSEVAGSETPAPTPVPSTNNGLAAPEVTELLPNPASPQTDTDDEFIELYNPNGQAFDLSSYGLQSGTTTLHNYVFPTGTSLPAYGYSAFFSRSTHLSLSNTGGQARLLDPSGQVISQSEIYGAAADGQAWALVNDTIWQWTTTSTPGAANVIDSPAPPPSKATTSKTASSKSSASTKKATTSSKKSTSKKPTLTTSAANVSGVKATSDKRLSPIHPVVLVMVGGLALLYALYEYRSDLANRFHQLKRYRENRRASRQTAEGQ